MTSPSRRHRARGRRPERPTERSGHVESPGERSPRSADRRGGGGALTRDLSLLVRQELELAKAEMREKGRIALPGLGMIGCRRRRRAGRGRRAHGLPRAAVEPVPRCVARCAHHGDRARRGRGDPRDHGQGARRGDRHTTTGANDRDRPGGRPMGQGTGEIRQDIEQTRARVGDEVEALSYKTDVGARLDDYVDEKKEAVTSKVRGATEAVASAASERSFRASSGSGRCRIPPSGTRSVSPSAARRSGSSRACCFPRRGSRTSTWGRWPTQIKDTAREAGHDALDRGKEVAQSAIETVKEEGGAADAGARLRTSRSACSRTPPTSPSRPRDSAEQRAPGCASATRAPS